VKSPEAARAANADSPIATTSRVTGLGYSPWELQGYGS
jgi:hypothetical protein